MITDAETSFLYLSEKVKLRDGFAKSLLDILRELQIPNAFLPCTQDVWAVDYMPIQTSENRFVRFRYDPDYLQFKKYQSSITNSKAVCHAIGIETIDSDINLDGGNVVRGRDWVILTDKIFKENPKWDGMKLIAELERLFETRVIIIPREPGDYTGHADAMLRHYDNETVLLNAYRPDDKKDFQRNLKISLRNAGLRWIEIPYNPYGNPSNNEAHGLYINFLHMRDFLLVPTFGLHEDERALNCFQELFKGHHVEGLNSIELSKDGGVLNCTSWNIYKPHWPEVTSYR